MFVHTWNKLYLWGRVIATDHLVFSYQTLFSMLINLSEHIELSFPLCELGILLPSSDKEGNQGREAESLAQWDTLPKWQSWDQT